MVTDTVSTSYEKGRVEVAAKFPKVWSKKELFWQLFPSHRNYQSKLLKRMLSPHFTDLGIESEAAYRSFRLFTLEQSVKITQIIMSGNTR